MRQGKNTETLAVGCGAGFSGDRVDAPGPPAGTPKPIELSKFFVSEVGKWTRLTKEAGIEPK